MPGHERTWLPLWEYLVRHRGHPQRSKVDQCWMFSIFVSFLRRLDQCLAGGETLDIEDDLQTRIYTSASSLIFYIILILILKHQDVY